ncbi:hypothetical protein B566_EDAN002802 [Ephemera danica]|nr:hypothetical protein B566_EDAN002802 [Ephemera danica]
MLPLLELPYLEVTESQKRMSSNELIDVKNLLWGPAVKDDVFKRWSQGFVFSEGEPSALVQWEGGPCAVLAPVQAYILKSIMNDAAIAEQWRKCNNLLACALCEILVQAVPPGKPVQMTKLQQQPVEVNGEVDTTTSPQAEECEIGHTRFHERLQIFSVSNVDELLHYLQENIDSLKSTYGVLLFLYSVLLTRGIEELRRDLLDPAEPLIDCNHGYGSQSLINLVLTGRAVGHVWDREQNVGGLTLRGLERQMLFSTEKALVSAETPSEAARRVFKSFDPEGNNFIAVKTLPEVLQALDLVSDPPYVEIMRKKLDVENLGIILLGVFMEEFFPVAYVEGQAVMLESLVGPSILESNPMLTCLQTKWPNIEVQWLSASIPSLN